MLESLFNKVAGFQVCNFIKKSLQHRCFPVKFTKFIRPPILKNFYERLLLKKITFSVQHLFSKCEQIRCGFAHLEQKKPEHKT